MYGQITITKQIYGSNNERYLTVLSCGLSATTTLSRTPFNKEARVLVFSVFDDNDALKIKIQAKNTAVMIARNNSAVFLEDCCFFVGAIITIVLCN